MRGTLRRRAALLCAAALAGGAACPVEFELSVGGDRAGAPPRVEYLDLVAGPTSGGEGNAGAYLSIFGKGFGSEGLGTRVRVFIGGAEVARYFSLGPSKGRPDIEQITVQVGALGGAAPGSALPVEVRVDGRGSNADRTFTVQPGDLLYVDNVAGDDASAAKNDPDRPWRALQTPSSGGALGAARPGDVIVLRGKAPWSDVGEGNRWARLRYATGSAPTGEKGTGYLAIVAYPGEDVHFVPSAGTQGGIHGVYGVSDAEAPKWVVLSGLRLEGGGEGVTDAPINLQSHADHWRVVNNDVGPWAGPATARAAGIAGNGAQVAILGNHVHGIAGGTNNCVGLDTGAADVEVAYNHLEDCLSGSGVQTFDNVGVPLERIAVHHNRIHGAARCGVLLGDWTRSARVWNNLLYDLDGAGVRFHQSDPSNDTRVEENTVYNACRAPEAPAAAVVNTGSAASGAVVVANNIVARGPESSCAEGYANAGVDAALALRRNLWFGFSPPSSEADALAGDPRFADAASGDFHLLADSPAMGAAEGSAIGDDFDLSPRAVPKDLGALAGGRVATGAR